jgi:hypothetical protein
MPARARSPPNQRYQRYKWPAPVIEYERRKRIWCRNVADRAMRKRVKPTFVAREKRNTA